MSRSTQHRVSRLVAVVCAIAILGLALVAPTLMVHHARSSVVLTYELRFQNSPGAFIDADARKRIKHDVDLLSSVEVTIERAAPAREIFVQKSDANLSVEPRLIPHKKIASSPKGDPDLA